MKIAIVSDLLERGGAAIACHRLARALLAEGVEVRRFAFERGPRPPTSDGTVFAPEPFGRRAAAIGETIGALGFPRLADRLRRREGTRRLAAALRQWQPDLVNLHNLHGFSPRLAALPEILAIAPVVWTLHDMWSFTGRCSYCFDCRLFETGCTAHCPTPHEYPALPAAEIRGQWDLRRNIFARHERRLAAATPSNWLATEARRGLWARHAVAVIANSLDQTIYAPVPRTTARAALGLPPQDRPSVLVAADYLGERRKGGTLLLPALAACGQKIELLTLGHGTPTGLPDNVSVRPLGYVTHERTKALVYSSADLLFHPAPTDNFPNTIAESLSCGTPVVAAAIGGIPEMVPSPLCGALAATPDSARFATALSEVLARSPAEESTRAMIQEAVRPIFSPQRQANAYLALFAQLIADNRPARA